MEDFLIQDNQRVVFIGDSITDCGRRDNFAPFGNGYAKLCIDLITAKYPVRKITYFNRGISGNTIADLSTRWEQDVILLNPDWVTILIGINDLHSTLRNDGSQVPPEQFNQIYDMLLKDTIARTHTKLVLLDPFYVYRNDTDTNTDATRVLNLLDKYIQSVHQMVNKYRTYSVPLQYKIVDHLQYRPAAEFAPEPVHPYFNGHVIIAHELLRTLNW